MVPLELDSGINLVHIHTIGTHGRLDLAITARRSDSQFRYAQNEALRDGIFAGIFLANLLFALWLCVVVRYPSHYWYAAYQAVTLGCLFTIHHHAFAWLWPETIAFNLFDRTFTSIAIFGISAKFMNRLLDLHLHYPRSGRLLRWMANTLLFCSALQLVFPWWKPAFELLYFGNRIEVLEFSTYFLAYLLLVLRVAKMDRLAIQVALASLPMAFALVFGAGAEISHLPWMHQWRVVVMEWGLALENLALSFILVQRVVRDRRAHRELLERHLGLELDFSRRLAAETDRHLRGTALDLHDGVGQELTGLGLHLRSVLKQVGNQELADSVSWELGRVMEAVRQSAHRIYPPELMEGGLRYALERLSRSLAREGGMLLEIEGEMPNPGEEAALHWYRIVQEAISNAHRHAGSRKIQVRLHKDRIEVRNDGGPPPETIEEGMGLRSIRRRAAFLGCGVELVALPEGGCLRVSRDIPVAGEGVGPAPT